MSDAKPLKSDKRATQPENKARSGVRVSRNKAREEPLHPRAADSGLPFAGADGGDESMRFSRPSVGRRTMRKLARGGYRIEAEIDLHGMTVAEAEPRLADFVAGCTAQGRECIRIVHGKGLGSGARGPVLKRSVSRCLRQWDTVLAFAPAQQADGGTGAVYVLLRRN